MEPLLPISFYILGGFSHTVSSWKLPSLGSFCDFLGPRLEWEGLWAGSLVVYVFEDGEVVVCRPSPTTHSLHELLPDPAGLCFNGQAMGLCDPFSPNPVQLRMGRGRDSP